MRQLLSRCLAPLCFLLCVSSASATISVYEKEPNNTPASAELVSGAVQLVGTLTAGDQDGFRWQVSDVDAQKTWSFSFQGVPGRLSVVDVIRVRYADNGVDVVAQDKLFTLGSRDGSKPALVDGLLFEPGEYVLGIAQGPGGADLYRPPMEAAGFDQIGDSQQAIAEAPGSYRLLISEARSINPRTPRAEPTDKSAAQKLRFEAETTAYLEPEQIWFSMEIEQKHLESRWEIKGQIPVGQSVNASLLDAQDVVLATTSNDAYGRFNFPDLGLQLGTYYLVLKNAVASMKTISLRSSGTAIEGQEAEPNDKWAVANKADFSKPITGRMGNSGENDYFQFEVTSAVADRMQTLELTGVTSDKITLCLTDASGQALQCRAGPGTVALPDLQLAAGKWGVIVQRGTEGFEYSVSLNDQGAITAGSEAEPNDKFVNATAVPKKLRVKGRLSKEDRDYYKLLITGAPQLWRIQAIGDGIHELAYHDASGNTAQVYRTKGAQRRVRLENLYLMPGTHYIRVEGKDDGNYTLMARPIGAPDMNAELEPNDDRSRMNLLSMNQTRTGILEDAADRDRYRFHLANTDHIRLRIQPPVDGAIAATLEWGGAKFKQFNKSVVGEEVILEGRFPPGDYGLSIYPGVVSEAQYSLSLERLPYFSCGPDCEPNDNMAFANNLPSSGIVQGRVNEWRDADWFKLPLRNSEAQVSVALEPRRNIYLYAHSGEEIPLNYDAETALYTAVIPPSVQTFLSVNAWGDPDYTVRVQVDGDNTNLEPPAELPVSIDLDIKTKEVAAYLMAGQQVSGVLKLQNSSQQNHVLSLTAVSSDYRWSVALAQPSVELAAGESKQVSLKLAVPADAWSRDSVRVSVSAANGAGAQVEAYDEVVAVGTAAPVEPKQYWPLPDALLGGMNLAWSELGGRWIDGFDNSAGSGFEETIDGVVAKARGMSLRGGYKGPRQLTVALAGTNPASVAGVAITLLSHGGSQQFVKAFDLYLSNDAEHFELAYQGELLPIASEQAFVLANTVAARYARIVFRELFNGKLHSTGGVLGEFKVIGTPAADLVAAEGYNVAAPGLGGHVVWSDPYQAQSRWDAKILSDQSTYEHRRLGSGDRLEWVLGLHHNRAAQIARLRWYNAAESTVQERITQVNVAVSLESPMGPWQPLGEWAVKPQELEANWTLDAPVWARFIKFSTAIAPSQTMVAMPAMLQVFERPADDEYRSILAEWGLANRHGIYEYLHPPQLPQKMTAGEHTSRGSARSLSEGETAYGQVLLDKVDNWYQFVMPEHHNTLTLALTGDATVGTRLAVEDEAGEVLQISQQISSTDPNKHLIEVFAEPASKLFIKVYEPARNAVFLWDTSSSIGAYLPVIYNALSSYASGLVPGRDAANLMPFGSDLLLRDWYGDPYVLQNVINDYPRKESSSAAEKTLSDATRELSRRAGAKAIVMVTDAATSQYSEMWRNFDKVKPRIFAVGVSSEGAFGRHPRREQDLMQDWASVNGGYYSHVLDEGAMEVAFDRAITMLRAPQSYSLTPATEFRKAPGPGRLKITGTQTATGQGGAIELILDASGSMLKRVDGTRRIEIAKQVLVNAVSNYIPAGTPVAVRVFGHREANACRTDLEVPLAPLKPSETAAMINKITAKNLAKTPIAKSLQLVSKDLAKASGRKVIVLVTDGEETCEGDASEVIEKLIASGFDMTLNIVGFAINDNQLEAEFESWATQGGGDYFSARDGEALQESVLKALSVPYKVYSLAGELVASGVVGDDGVELPQGTYRVVAQTSPQRIFDSVSVPGETTTELQLE